MKTINAIFDLILAIGALLLLIDVASDYSLLNKQPSNLTLAGLGFIILVRINDLHTKLDKHE